MKVRLNVDGIPMVIISKEEAKQRERVIEYNHLVDFVKCPLTTRRKWLWKWMQENY